MQTDAQMSTLARWLKVSRAPFLTVSAMPVLVGTSLKVDGRVENPVDISRVRNLVNLKKMLYPA